MASANVAEFALVGAIERIVIPDESAISFMADCTLAVASEIWRPCQINGAKSSPVNESLFRTRSSIVAVIFEMSEEMRMC